MSPLKPTQDLDDDKATGRDAVDPRRGARHYWRKARRQLTRFVGRPPYGQER